jgi:hypothetical protein
MTTPLYFPLATLSKRAQDDVSKIAYEWLGANPWAYHQQWFSPDGKPVIPLHLAAGRDLAVRVLKAWREAPYYPKEPQDLLAALTAVMPKE